LTSLTIQLEEFTAKAFCSPKSIMGCHFLDEADRLGRELRLSRMSLGFALPEQAEEFTVPAEKRRLLERGRAPVSRFG
jgi:hypothetical protein